MRPALSVLLVLTLIAPSVAWTGQVGAPRTPPARLDVDLRGAPRTIGVLRGAPRTIGVLRGAPRTIGVPAAGPRTVSADPAALCETALATAEVINRLPPRLLGAIGATESGRSDPVSGRLRPWPWTINAEGEGRFFGTRHEAVAAVTVLQARGVRSIDVGCMQVNLMFHPDAFATLDDAFDPSINARYAARFLNALYAEGKDWAHAIAAYHSETPALGDAYRLLVMARWRNGDLRAAPASGAVYRDFVPGDVVYGAFAPRSRAYGAFAPR